MIETGGEKKPGRSVLATEYDDVYIHCILRVKASSISESCEMLSQEQKKNTMQIAYS